MNDNLTSRVAALLEETGKAHHEAFASTGGDDPEWPLWYANHARDRLAEQFELPAGDGLVALLHRQVRLGPGQIGAQALQGELVVRGVESQQGLVRNLPTHKLLRLLCRNRSLPDNPLAQPF